MPGQEENYAEARLRAARQDQPYKVVDAPDGQPVIVVKPQPAAGGNGPPPIPPLRAPALGVLGSGRPARRSSRRLVAVVTAAYLGVAGMPFALGVVVGHVWW